jgi:hypothetical protein
MATTRQRKLEMNLGYVPALVYVSTPHGDSTITVWCTHQQEFEDLKSACVEGKPFTGRTFALPNNDTSRIVMVAMKRPEHAVA